MYPDFDKKPPLQFEAILETPAGEPASLNTGNAGPESFLFFTKNPQYPPITGLTIINESEDYILPEDYKILQISPSGKIANINKKTTGNRLFIGFKGGVDSHFGYLKGKFLIFNSNT